jgi:hypothetical protein
MLQRVARDMDDIQSGYNWFEIAPLKLRRLGKPSIASREAFVGASIVSS